jgi:hypothetical protein
MVMTLWLLAQILKHVADELSITDWADLVDELYERWPICLPGVGTFVKAPAHDGSWLMGMIAGSLWLMDCPIGLAMIGDMADEQWKMPPWS